MQRREAESYGPMSDADYQEGRAFYYASFEELDAQIGRILKALDETGQTENTLVVFVADHGAQWGAHRMWIPCFAPYEETYHIPLIMRWPARIKPASTCNRLAQLHDLAHTFVDVLDVSRLPHPDGVSLKPLMQDPGQTTWREHILCPWYGQNFLMIQRMVVTERYKYVFNGYDFDECYDLQGDPEEMRNLVSDPSHRAVVDDMRARLYELMNQYRDPYGDKSTGTTNQKRFHLQRYLPRGKRLEVGKNL